jgi:polyisoprenoid-binding protein YceI
VIGNLTIKDVTKQVELPFTLAQAEVRGKKKLGIETSLTINRLDYHVNYDPSGTTVSKEVKIEIDLEVNQQ